jgi:hypothetical protein
MNPKIDSHPAFAAAARHPIGGSPGADKSFDIYWSNCEATLRGKTFPGTDVDNFHHDLLLPQSRRCAA